MFFRSFSGISRSALFRRALNAPRGKRGFTLVEMLVAAAILAVVSISIYRGYTAIMTVSAAARVKVTAAALGNEMFEIARNLPYNDVGVEGSIPNGTIPREQELVRDGFPFTVTTTVRNVDDPFDGMLGESPNDTSPADYKLFQVELSCDSCRNFESVKMTTRIAPKNLETASTNGALFVQVFDANGVPVQGAEVHIENNSETPAIVIDDVTNDDGMLQLVDVPPADESYEITVTKDGYSTARTYSTEEIVNPLQPHATVLLQQVTQASFAIDKLSSINLASITPSCSPIGNVGFSFTGSKLIATLPDVVKYSETLSTDSSGLYESSDIEWDSYMLSLAGPTYDIIGTNAVNPVTVAPDSSTDIQMILAPKDPRTLVVSVKDLASGLPVSGAEVSIEGPESGTKTTGRGFQIQTDWSGGAGQATSTDLAKYYVSDGNIEEDLPEGELRLKNIFGQFEPAGVLESSTFDTGSVSNFHEVIWMPYDQPVAAGEESVKFQIATNNDTVTWDYTGPDGTASSYYTTADRNISADHDGDRYLRYKVFLATADTSTTPTVSDVSFTFTSECTPPGQVSWSGLGSGTYTVSVEKDGYQDFEAEHEMDSNWEYYEVELAP